MRILCLLLLLLSSFECFALDVSLTDETKKVESDVFSLSLSRMKLYISVGDLTIGEIDRRGLLRTLSEPHEGRFDLVPKALPFSNSGTRYGALLRLGPLSLFTTLNDRLLGGMALNYEHFSFATLYAAAGYDEGPFMEDRKDSENWDVLFTAFSFNYWIFSGMGIGTFSPELGFDGLLSLSVGYGKYSLTFTMGSPPVLYSDKERYMYSVSVTLGEAGFLSRITMKMGNTPIFSDDYRPYEAEIVSYLTLHGFRFYSSMEYSFSKKGNSRKSDRFTVEIHGVKIGYDSDYGLVAVYDAGKIEAGYDEGRFFAALTFEAFGEHSELKVRLSSDSLIDISLSLDL